MADDPALASVPSFEGFSIVETPPEIGEAADNGSEFEWNSVAEQPASRPEVSFADLNETEGAPKVEAGVFLDPLLADPFAGPESATPPERAAERASEPAVGAPASAEAMMYHELESVDFYIAQGYSDIAFDTLELLERQFGPHPEIDSRHQRLNAAKPSADGADSSLVTDPLAPSAKPGVEIDSAVEIAFGEIEIAGFEQAPVVSRPVVAVAPVAPVPVGTGIDSGLAEIFEEFRMEAEGESSASTEDYETHYNMATAYKEMDLLDEAIREFQAAAGMTGSADGTARYFQCCNMLGHCFVQKEMPRAAVIWFKKGLDAPGRTPEEYKALQYELGSAFEGMGDWQRAVAAFTEVYGVDVGYRDIAGKLESLQARAAAQKKKKKGK
jgi:tetratricopeptide (TPR) repeat protein